MELEQVELHIVEAPEVGRRMSQSMTQLTPRIAHCCLRSPLLHTRAGQNF